jgi:hypothetical protein
LFGEAMHVRAMGNRNCCCSLALWLLCRDNTCRHFRFIEHKGGAFSVSNSRCKSGHRYHLEPVERRALFSITGDIEWAHQFGGVRPQNDYVSATDVRGGVYVAGNFGGGVPGQPDYGGNDHFLRKYDAEGHELWTRQFGTDGNESIGGLAVDAAGNVYVGGTFPQPGTSPTAYDLFVRKFDADGNDLWVRQLGSNADEHNGVVAADDAGNVYLAGYTTGTLPGQTEIGKPDPVLAKYDAAGNKMWVRQFGTPASDVATAVGVDAAGNVIVSGETLGEIGGPTNGINSETFVQKYDGDGNVLWSRQFGSLNQPDIPSGVFARGDGSIYISGFTLGALPGFVNRGGYDAYLVKYDADGNAQWQRQFGTRDSDYGYGVTADAADNAYLVGNTAGKLPGQGNVSSATDAFVRKYDAAGTELWTRQFGTKLNDFGSGIAADTAGNVYVAGRTNGTFPGQPNNDGAASPSDGFLRKYDSAGGELWTRQFGSFGGAGVRDVGTDVATDSAGNVYVVSEVGAALPGEAHAGMTDVVLRKYDAGGRLLWTAQFGSTSSDLPNAVQVDDAGRIYVVGFTFATLDGATSAGDADGFVRTFDPNGNVLWTRQFGTAKRDTFTDLAVDATGNIYISGSTAGTAPGQTAAGLSDALVCKYDATGNLIWARQFGSPVNDGASGIGVDSVGDVYVAGSLPRGFALPGQTNSGRIDTYIRKYSAAGVALWTRQYGTAGDEQAVRVAVDESDNLYVVGTTTGAFPGQTNAGNRDVYLRKFDLQGNTLWTRQIGSPDTELAADVAVDGRGKVYVAGTTAAVLPDQTNAGATDSFVRKFDSDGNVEWSRQFGTALSDTAAGIVADGNGAVYVTGDTTGTFPGEPTADGSPDAFLVKLSDNMPPVAIDAFASVVEDGTVLIDLRALLSDDYTAPDQLVYEIVTQPAGGDLEATDVAGVYRFTPHADIQPDQVSFSYRAVDGHGEPSNLAAVTIQITRYVGVTLTGGVLRVGGSDGIDRIRIDGKKLRWNGTQTPLAGITEVRVWARGGDDSIDLSKLPVRAFVNAGAGDDHVDGTQFDDLLLGSAGDDRLSGDAGSDVIIGGIGRDRIDGDRGDDILIAGDAAGSIERFWARQLPDRLVDDGDVDRLNGSSGVDWFFIGRSDRLLGRKWGDVVTFV